MSTPPHKRDLNANSNLNANLSTITELTNETYGDMSNHSRDRSSQLHIHTPQPANQPRSLLSPTSCMLVNTEDLATSDEYRPLGLVSSHVTIRKCNQGNDESSNSSNNAQLRNVITNLINNASEIRIDLVDEQSNATLQLSPTALRGGCMRARNQSVENTDRVFSDLTNRFDDTNNPTAAANPNDW